MTRKVNLRFMGLFDTVLSTHVGSYNLGIPADFDYVAQAVGYYLASGGIHVTVRQSPGRA